MLEKAQKLYEQESITAFELAKEYTRVGQKLPWALMEQLEEEEVLQLPDEAFPMVEYTIDRKYNRVHGPLARSNSVTNTYRLGKRLKDCRREVSAKRLLKLARRLLARYNFDAWRSQNGNIWIKKDRILTHQERNHLRKNHLEDMHGSVAGLRRTAWLQIHNFMVRDLVLYKWMGFSQEARRARFA